MPVLSILAASLLAAPTPLTGKRVKPSDYPQRHIQDEKSAAAIVEIVVAPDGTDSRCTVLMTFGDEEFAREMCAFQNPHSWRPAVDSDGRPTYGIVRTVVAMFLPDTPQGDAVSRIRMKPDLELVVDKLPDTAKERLNVAVSVQSDASGKVIGCEPENKRKVPIAYRTLACERARQLSLGNVSVDGVALQSFVMSLNVLFVAAKPIAATAQ